MANDEAVALEALERIAGVLSWVNEGLDSPDLETVRAALTAAPEARPAEPPYAFAVEWWMEAHDGIPARWMTGLSLLHLERSAAEKCAAEVPEKTRIVELRFAPEGPAEHAEGWRPIESAPKDGTRVLLAHDRGGVCDGVWYNEVNDDDGTAPAGWYAYGYRRFPTHWRPLPAAPGEQRPADKEGS